MTMMYLSIHVERQKLSSHGFVDHDTNMKNSRFQTTSSLSRGTTSVPNASLANRVASISGTSNVPNDNSNANTLPVSSMLSLSQKTTPSLRSSSLNDFLPPFSDETMSRVSSQPTHVTFRAYAEQIQSLLFVMQEAVYNMYEQNLVSYAIQNAPFTGETIDDVDRYIDRIVEIMEMRQEQLQIMFFDSRNQILEMQKQIIEQLLDMERQFVDTETRLSLLSLNGIYSKYMYWLEKQWSTLPELDPITIDTIAPFDLNLYRLTLDHPEWLANDQVE